MECANYSFGGYSEPAAVLIYGEDLRYVKDRPLIRGKSFMLTLNATT
jgi:hypothetical protein